MTNHPNAASVGVALSETALDIDSLLAVIEDHFDHCVAGDVADHGAAYYQGLCLAAESAREKARRLNEALDVTHKPNQEEAHELLDRLSGSQRAVVAALMADMLNAPVAELHVATKDSARMALAKFEAETQTLTAQECASELEAWDIWVALDGEGDSATALVSHVGVSLNGLRGLLARERFVGSVECDQDQHGWQESA